MVEFLVLGWLEVCRDGEPVQLRGHRQRKLLALLLLSANRIVPMDVLVDELWDDPPQSARPQVHNAIRDLRRVLSGAGEVRLVTEDVGYRLVVPQDSVDAHRFASRLRAARAAEREGRLDEAIALLQSAVELWRADAFAGIQCRAVGAAAVRLNEQRLTAIEELMALRMRAGECASLVGELHALIAAHPLRDSLRGTLMEALYRGGRQADALAVYEEGRRYLLEELGLDPSPDLKALHAQILAGAPPAAARPARPAAPETAQRLAAGDSRRVDVSRTIRPGNYLPHDLADFTGREEELDRALGLAGRGPAGSPVMISIDGMGGVGKTSFAVHLAHRLAPLFPDGQYFVALNGFNPLRAPSSPEQALRTLLLASGLEPDAVPSDLPERSALWRALLAGKRCLLILDDAADSAQVRPLLPGTGGCLVLVTSRRKLAGLDGAEPVPLDVFPPQDALALFTRIAGPQRVARENAEAARAVELCGFLPLAVRIAATKLRDRAAWSVQDLVARLSEQAQRIRLLQSVDRDLVSTLGESYKHLDRSHVRFSKLISREPAPRLRVEDAAAVTGLPADEVERCFDVLLENNLVRQDAPGWFSLHRLIRDCVGELDVDDADGAADAARRLTAAGVSG